jgi:phosphatidylinositol alpha-mannosyltransferase
VRIAMVCPYSLSRPGGVQGQVIGLSRSLRAIGHQVTILAPDDDHPVGVVRQFDAHQEPSGAGAASSDSGSPVEEVYVVGHSTSLHSNGSVAPVTISPIAAFRTQRFVHTHALDVIHFHEPMAPTVSYGCLLRDEVPTVGTFHRSGDSSWYRALRPLARWATGRLDALCAVSEAARDTAAAALNGEYEVLFNGVEISRFATAEPYPSDRPTVLFLGRHEVRKGLGVLLEAFAQVPDPAVLWVAGDGPVTEILRRQYPPSDRVQWLGMLSEDQVASRLAGADVLCAPSLRGESFGMVLLEAMAAGCAVVASDLDGYRSAAAGHATLVPPGDAPALAKALIEAVADAAEASGHSSASAKGAAIGHAEGWSMDRLALRYVAIYREAIETYGLRNRRVI